MKTSVLASVLAWLAAAAPAAAFDLNDDLSLGVTLATVGQCQRVSGGGTSNSCRGATPLQIEGAFRPAQGHELGFKLGFAAGNGLNLVSPFALAPWAADLENDVKNINGRDRDYLLAAWYRYEVQLAEDNELGAVIGILDSTQYLDNNEYANDEYTQFMNQVFVHSGSYGLPSYDAGAVLQWRLGDWSLNGVAMNVGQNGDGNTYNFYASQLAYHVETDLGPGNYRLILAGTSDDFRDLAGTSKTGRYAGGLSFDQSLGGVVGAFLRFAWQDDGVLLDYGAIYSGGLDIKGAAWGREADNVGIGYAYLPRGNGDLKRTQVFETYYRFGVTDAIAATADLQWMQASHRAGVDAADHDGWIFGLRLVLSF